MKNLISYLFILMAGGLLGGCNEEAVEVCNTTATLRHNICGVGLWGGYVLELENGEIVQPWATDLPQVARLAPAEGLKLRVGISTVPRDDRYNGVSTCLAMGPYASRITRQVRVDCAELLDASRACDVKATFRHNVCGVGLWGAYLLELENGEIVQPWAADEAVQVASFAPRDGQKVMVKMYTVPRDGRYDQIMTCAAVGPYSGRIARQVRIDCITALGN